MSNKYIEIPVGGAGAIKLQNMVVISDVNDWPLVLSSDVQYFIDGTIQMGTRSLEVPAGGLHLAGYDLELSFLISSAPNYTMFTSPVGGSGNILGQDFAIEVSGTNSQVYDVFDATGFNAIELSRINYNNCTSLGTMSGYRQGLELGTGRFGGSPSLTLAGTWVGGFRITTSIVRQLSAGMTEPLFKAGTAFTMQSRFLSDINVDLPALASMADFAPANFPNDRTLQLNGCIVTRDGVVNTGDTNLFPNISHTDISSSWTENVGINNTFEGGRATVSTEIETVVSTIGTFYPLLGTFTISELQHFDSPVNGQLRHLAEGHNNYNIISDMAIDSSSGDTLTLRIRKYTHATTSFSTIYTQNRPVNNLTGPRDVAYFNIIASTILEKNDYIFFEVANETSTANALAEIDSFYVIQQRK